MAQAIQVTRRIRRLLQELRDSVRTEYRPAVDAQIARLDATVATSFAGSVDQDRQGIGGPAETRIFISH